MNPRLPVPERIGPSTRRLGLTSASLAALALTAAQVWPAHPSPSAPTAVVTEAPFRDVLVARGAVSSARLMSYGSTIAGVQAKILTLVPEGTAVQPGDEVVRFDATPFEEAAVREATGVAQAEAELLRATEDLRQEQLRSTVETEAARDDVSEAEAALANVRDGRGPVALAEAETAVNDATRELARARAAESDMQALLDKGFVTRLEADRAALATRQAEDRDRVARLKLDTLRTFEQPAALDKSKADVSAASRNLSGAEATAASRLVQRQAARALAESHLAEARARLAHARDDVARTVVRSSSTGLVVYQELFFGTERRKPQPGDEVWPNQPIVAVPDSTQVVVESRIREIDLHKVAPGAPVAVTVDAYPDLRLRATVGLVGALAQEDVTRAGAKFFPVTVTVIQPDPRLRTGMTARVEIEVAEIERALVVPVQALVERPDGSVACEVVSGRQVTTRTVRVAGRNDLVAAVASGLRLGEVVRLVDPAQIPNYGHDRP